MKEKTQTKKENKKLDKKSKGSKKVISGRFLGISLYVIVIILISLISFVGIYARSGNKMTNILPEYILGTDIYGARNIVIKVDDSTETKTYDSEGNLVEDGTETEGETTTKEEPINDESVLTADNYKKVKQIVIDRLNYMNVGYYEIKCDEANGTIYLEVPENSNTDYIAQYSVTKGEFKMSDSDTDEVFLTNKDIKEAKVQYGTTTNGTTVYLTIKFNKEGKEKLKEISTQYSTTESEENITETNNNEEDTTESEENSETENAEVEDTSTETTTTTSKEVKLTLDDQTIISSGFEEPITDGIIQLSLGTSTDATQINSYLQQASNIAVFLNTEAMPITYEIDINRFAFSDITTKAILTIAIVCAVIYAVMLIYMIIKYKKLGALGAVTSIGFVALLLIVLRYTNVDITGTGHATIGIVAVLEYLSLMNIFKVNSKDLDKETKQKEVKHTLIKQIETVIPLAIVAVVFAIAKWESVYSMGMILFWGIMISLLYNFIAIKIMLPKGKE